MSSKAKKAKTFNKSSAAIAKEQKLKLFTAAVANDLAGVQRIVMEYPDAPTWRDTEGLTSLMMAAQEGAQEAAWVLSRADNADIDAENENGSTALMYAAFNGKASVAEVLLKAGADINHTNQNGHTALMSAAAHGYRNTMILLLEFGADPTSKDSDGTSVLDYAHDNEFPELAKLLKEALENWVPPSPKDAFAEVAKKDKSYKTSDTIRELEQKLIKAKLT